MNDYIVLNEKPIEYDGYKLTFIKTKYVYGGTAVIVVDEEFQPYAYVSINLTEYGYHPSDDCIFLNHDLSVDFVEMFKENFVKETVDYKVGGFVMFECVRLKGDM